MHVTVTVVRPADAHFFRHVVAGLTEAGHEVTVFAREASEASRRLAALDLDHTALQPPTETIPDVSDGRRQFEAELARACRRAEPDVLTGVDSPLPARVGALTDTSSTSFLQRADDGTRRIAGQLCDAVHTPAGVGTDLGSAHHRYAGIHELAYLHPDRFQANAERLREAGIDPDRPYFVVDPPADQEHSTDDGAARHRRAIVDYLDSYGHVYELGSAATGDEELPVPPNHVHELLAGAALYVGSDVGRATAAALLDTPTIALIDGDVARNCAGLCELEEWGLVDRFERTERCLERVTQLVPNPTAEPVWRERRERFLDETVDVAAYVTSALLATASEPAGQAPTAATLATERVRTD